MQQSRGSLHVSQPSRDRQQQQQTEVDTATKRQAAREVIDILHEISILLNTHLDRKQLSLCVSLIENGVNPEALANVIKMLRDQSSNGPGDNNGNKANDQGVARRTL